jgi:hypothetical protein
MLKKINNIFRLKGIFDFLHLHFDTVRAQSDGSGMESKKVWSSDAEVHETFSVARKELQTFIMAYMEKTLKKERGERGDWESKAGGEIWLKVFEGYNLFYSFDVF